MEASGKENPQGQRSLVTRSRLTVSDAKRLCPYRFATMSVSVSDVRFSLQQKLGIYGKAKMSEPARSKLDS